MSGDLDLNFFWVKNYFELLLCFFECSPEECWVCFDLFWALLSFLWISSSLLLAMSLSVSSSRSVSTILVLYDLFILFEYICFWLEVLSLAKFSLKLFFFLIDEFLLDLDEFEMINSLSNFCFFIDSDSPKGLDESLLFEDISSLIFNFLSYFNFCFFCLFIYTSLNLMRYYISSFFSSGLSSSNQELKYLTMNSELICEAAYSSL